jgi:SagB-type dehydrogenase family enzyme
MRMFDYHEETKHTLERLYARPHTLDWANMPDPFRHYEGVPILDLPSDAPQPQVPALRVLRGERGDFTANGPHWLSSLLFHSAAISATKRVPSTGHRYALRVNPSSGNLHPTEFHFVARGIEGWPDGLYHYRPSQHTAEQRMRGDASGMLGAALRDYPLVFVLTSIAWREAWKYRERAYRYCCHDIGHAWGAVGLAARALGCEAFAHGHFGDEPLREAMRLGDEWPMLIMAIQGPAIPRRKPEAGQTWFGGTPNRISEEQVPYPVIDAIHRATSHDGSSAIAQPAPRAGTRGSIALRPLEQSDTSFAVVSRRRRSALDFEGGWKQLRFEQLSTQLDVATRPFQADFEGDLYGTSPARYIELYLFVHRVNDLERGIYRHDAETGTLECIATGDQRLMAAGLSLGQDLAGNSCVTYAMIADLERAARDHGERAYRYVFFEAGMIGQRLYLAAEAMGFQSTGIGAFYDDNVHRYLNIEPAQGQVIYHFASGYAIHDPRIEDDDPEDQGTGR